MGFLDDLFGGGMSDAIGGASDVYQGYLNKAMGYLQKEQAGGRTDIQDYLKQALGYGEPYRQAGQEALEQYKGSLGLAGGTGQQGATDAFKASPGYQFALKQGLQATQRGAAARGLAGSGAEQRALQQTGQGLAQQEYGHWQQRLAGLAGMGQQAAGQAAGQAYGAGGTLAQLGLGYGQSISQLYGTMGQAQAEAQMAQAKEQEEEDSSAGGIFGDIIGGIASIAKL